MKTDDHRPDLAGRGEAVYCDPSAAPEPVPLTHAANPVTSAMTAEVLAQCVVPFNPDADLESMQQSLLAAMELDPESSVMLFRQAHLLDALFHRLFANAVTVKTYSGEICPDLISNTHTDLALRTQRQCRSTVEVVSTLKRRAEMDKNA